MSARQPFFSAQCTGSESQGTTQGFNKKTFLMDSSNPLHHVTSQAATAEVTKQSDSTKIAFSVPGPFSSNSANNAPQIETSGIAGLLKRKSARNLTQSVEKDRQGSLDSLGFLDLGNGRPGTADPRSEIHQDRQTALESQFGFGYQKVARRSMGPLDPGSIIRPGTTIPQPKALQDFAARFDIKAPIPKPATPASSIFLSHDSMSHFPFSFAEFGTFTRLCSCF